ncbi:MAG: HEAT repeat domain-containing protein [Syntrophomonadaceae bacterium]|nr:HEAT repeat domain-containing protein [Syntrophomonadaceae bacterium]
MNIPWWIAALAGIVLALIPVIFMVGKTRPRYRLDKQQHTVIRLGRILARGQGALSFRQVRLIEKTEPSLIMRLMQRYFHYWPRERQAAVANLLARLGYTELALKQLESSDPQERAQAAEILGILQSPSGVEPLLDLLGDAEEDVCWAASAALQRIQEPTTIDPLIRALDEPGEATPARVADILLAMGPAIVENLLQYLPQMGEQGAGTVLAILGHIGDERALPALMAGAQADSPWIRSQAVQALGEMRALEAVSILMEVLQKDAVSEVRARAAQALGVMECWEALPALKLARKDDHWVVRVSANQALAEITGKNKPVQD